MIKEIFNFANATPEERAEHLKELKERALKRREEAEAADDDDEDLDEDDDDEAEEQERIERMAAAETRVVEQMARERAGKPKGNAGKQDGNESYFPAELEKLITMALEDGNVTAQEREVLHRKAQSLGVDPDELDMVLNSRIEKAQDRKRNGGKYFIENLKKEMNDVCILEMGTYGKKVEDTRATKERRKEILLAANPTTKEEIKEYITFLSSYAETDSDGDVWSFQESEWNKLNAVFTKAKSEYCNDTAYIESILQLKRQVYAPRIKRLRKSNVKWATIGLFVFPIAILKIISNSKKIKEFQN